MVAQCVGCSLGCSTLHNAGCRVRFRTSPVHGWRGRGVVIGWQAACSPMADLFVPNSVRSDAGWCTTQPVCSPASASTLIRAESLTGSCPGKDRGSSTSSYPRHQPSFHHCGGFNCRIHRPHRRQTQPRPRSRSDFLLRHLVSCRSSSRTSDTELVDSYWHGERRGEPDVPQWSSRTIASNGTILYFT